MIISEIGHNHNGNMQLMIELIRQAKINGADIAKFQLYDIDKILKPEHPAYEDLKRGQLSKDDWFRSVDECNRQGIEFLASPFDVERVGWCQEAGVKRFKIASRSIYDMELIEAVRVTGKDMIISLGMVDERGIPKLPESTIVRYLYCVAKYPAPLSDLHLGKVDFRKYAGFSDHTEGIEAAMVAISRGADIIEKHFTLSKSMDGCDHVCSMEPLELKQLSMFAEKVREMA